MINLSIEQKEKIIHSMELIAADMEADAHQLDGKPFNGNTVAIQFGNNCAAIRAVALALQTIIEMDK